jgi:ferritin-like metal-binding protein YciE
METTMATKSKSAKRPSKGTKKESPDCTELLVLELQEIHNAETQLARAIPRFVKAVESEKLQQVLQTRLEQGEQLIQDIETALEEMEQSPGRKKNVAAEGLLNDMREHIQEIEAGPALDAVLIAAIQKTEHYCIAAWGTARSLAQALDNKTTVKAMERALKEGRKLDEQLTQLAEQEITPQLVAEEEDLDTDEAGEGGENEEEEEEEEEEGEDEAKPSRSRRGSGSERRAPN